MDFDETPGGIDPKAARLVLLGMIALVAAGAVAFALLRPRPTPPPAAIAGDPLLVAGHEAFLDRCISCHGVGGRGDGPIARGLAGPPPRDLTRPPWKHGDRPEQVLRVIAEGVPGTSMPGWGSTLGPDRTRAVAAYVYALAGRAVPDELRRGGR